jgi:hypothetical protein
MGEERSLAMLLVFVQVFERTATDDLLTALALRGETKRRREHLRTLKGLDQAALVLPQAVQLLIDDTVPAGGPRQQMLGAIVKAHLPAAGLWQALGAGAHPTLLLSRWQVLPLPGRR